MRGGAFVPLIWGAILVVLGTINAIWTDGNVIQSGTFLAAIGSVLALGLLLVALSPEARRRGAPEPRTDLETVPSASLAAMIAGLAFGCFLFGFAFGHFPMYFGAALLIAALARLALEVRAERRARRRLLRSDER
jgi:hypothetical protein